MTRSGLREFMGTMARAVCTNGENGLLIAKVLAVGNYYEETGMLAKSGLVDREFFLELYSGNIMLMWDLLSEYTAITREAGGSGLWENFEYSAVLSQDWMAQHPSGTYPANVRRIDLSNKWRDADLAYAASLAT